MSEVFLCETGQLTAGSKRDLRKAGIVVVEVADLSKAQFIRATETVSADDMLWAALDALRMDFEYGNHGAKQRERLAHNLFSLVARERKEQGKLVWQEKAS